MNYLRAALVPCAFALAAWYCVAPDYFYRFGDPDFGYMFNSLRLAEGMSVWHVDHPGTILQLLGAIVIVALKLARHTSDGLTVLVQNLNQVYFSTLALSVLFLITCQFILGLTLLRRGYSFLIVLAAQLTPALFAEFPFGLVRLNSETALAATGLLVTAAVAPFMESAGPRTRRELLLLGCAIGAAMTTKANVWPIALLTTIPLLGTERRIKDFFLLAGTTLATFLVITIPAWPRYRYFAGWISRTFWHSGVYADAPEFAVAADFKTALGVYVNWHNSLPQTIAVLLALALLVAAVSRRQLSNAPVLAALVCMTFLLMRRPVARYAVSLVPLVAISVLFLPRLRPALGISLAALLVCLATLGFGDRTRMFAKWSGAQTYQYHLLADFLNGPKANCAVAIMGSVTLPEAGLIDGSGPGSLDDFFSPRLNKMFPRYFLLRQNFFGEFGWPFAVTEWVTRVNKFPCQVFVAPHFWPEALGYASGLFEGPIQNISFPDQKLNFRLFYHEGPLALKW